MTTALFPYQLYHRNELISQLNILGSLHIPFLFIIDFEGQNGYIIKSYELDDHFVKFDFSGENILKKENNNYSGKKIEWEIMPVSFEEYHSKFQFVMDQIHKGNTYLVNLTQPTEIKTNVTLLDLYELGTSKYKLWLKDKFTVFSPEIFIKINNGKISTFPMKGTINASVTDAEKIILNDPKENAEHATIVDLLRNDLSIKAINVEVKRHRYIDRLRTNKNILLQVSSEITGILPENYHKMLGDILFSMLPAGSISGAPKNKTMEIIHQIEGYKRGFYTGICGWFDGNSLDSAVMIRYIEQKGNKLIFKSGGGITFQSDSKKEYQELIEKVYAPIY